MANSDIIEAPLPKGVNDFLPEMAEKIAFIDGKIRRVFELWGFRRISTPMLEFDDVMSLGIDGELKGKSFRFEDRQSGKLLAIPSDITPQIARIVASRMKSYPLPHRIFYSGRVLRHAEIQSGRNREIYQAGVELIGLSSPEADAEMVAMAVEILKELGFTNFKIDLGHVEFYRGIMSSAAISPQIGALLREAIALKDATAVTRILENETIDARVKREIASLPRLFGDRRIIAEAASVVTNDRSKMALDNIASVMDILDIYGVSDHITIDLGEIRGLDYHTGLTFEGFVQGHGEQVCGGGRYDDLTARYGFSSPATGFAFNILSLLGALSLRPEVEASKTRDFLLFNQKEDRRDALEIAKNLRARGYTTARDIIRRSIDDSLDYARRMNILRMMVIGGDNLADDEVLVINVIDNSRSTVKKTDLLREDFSLHFQM